MPRTSPPYFSESQIRNRIRSVVPRDIRGGVSLRLAVPSYYSNASPITELLPTRELVQESNPLIVAGRSGDTCPPFIDAVKISYAASLNPDYFCREHLMVFLLIIEGRNLHRMYLEPVWLGDRHNSAESVSLHQGHFASISSEVMFGHMPEMDWQNAEGRINPNWFFTDNALSRIQRSLDDPNAPHPDIRSWYDDGSEEEI